MVPKNMSLRLRLNLLITALSLAFMLAAGWVIVNDAKVSIRERVEAAICDCCTSGAINLIELTMNLKHLNHLKF
jgi:hypothetical protein